MMTILLQLIILSSFILCFSTAFEGRQDILKCIPEDLKGVLFETWNLQSVATHEIELQTLLDDENFEADKPSESLFLQNFSSVTDHGNNYGSRLRAYFVPPETGNYTFYVSCNRECKLHVRPNEDPSSDWVTMELIVRKSNWEKLQTPVYLEKNRMIYLRLLHVERGGPDYAKVGVMLPNTTSLKPIPRQKLIRYIRPESRKYMSPGEWGEWTVCSVTCDAGVQTRKRKCLDSPEFLFKGINSTYSLNETRECFDNNSCAAESRKCMSLGEWGEWSACSVTCDAGVQTRKRKCLDSPEFLFKGINSTYSLNETRECLNNNPCADIGLTCQSSVNMTIKSSGSTSIRVNWVPVQLAPHCGTLLDYRILYEVSKQRDRRSLELSNEHELIVNSSESTSELRGLQKFTVYCIQMIARSTTNTSHRSERKCVRTDEDVPSRAPQGVVAPNKTSPDSIKIQWNQIPKANVHGDLKAYRVLCSPVKIGQRRVSKPEIVIMVSPASTSLIIDGLEPYGTYCVQVAGVTTKGAGPSSSSLCTETCRCKETLSVDKQSLQGSTLISENSLAQLFRNVCSSCESYNETNVAITVSENPDISLTTKREYSSRHIHEDSFASLWKVPGLALVKRRDVQSVYPSLLAETLLSCWPVIAIIVLLTFLAGYILWILEVRHNKDFFPRSILGGQGEGIWWSIISMSTVGYGDRVPVTLPGRAFAIIWFLVGAVLVSLYTAALTTSLTVAIIRLRISKADVMHRGSVVANSTEEQVAMTVLRAQIEIGNRYNGTDDLIYALKMLNEDSVVDMFLPRKREDLWNDPELEFTFVPGIFVQGLRLRGFAARLTEDIQEFSRKENLQTKLIQELDKNNAKEKQEIDTAMKEKETETINFFDPSNKYFQLTLQTCSVMLFFACCCGLVFECFQRRRASRLSCDKPRRRIDEYQSRKAEMNEIVEEFYVCFSEIFREHKAACLELVKAHHKQMQNAAEETKESGV